MNAAEIKEFHTATPFEPFELVLPNGSAMLIPQPEFMMFSLDHRTIHVAQPEGGAKRIDAKLVTAVNELPRSKSRRKK